MGELDIASLKERYAQEREKRLRPDGNDQYLRITGRSPTTSTTPTAPSSSASRRPTT